METVIAAEGVHRSYQLGKTELEVLKGVDVEIAAGEHVFLCGASGAGKTTLMYTLAGLERPQAGRVLVEGRDLYGMSRGEQAAVRNSRMGYIFQNYYLLPELTAEENVMVPGMIGGPVKVERARELLDMVGLSKRREHLPSELSGGEQQRVAIARALVRSPSIVFADEPTGNLDSRNGDEIMNILLTFAEKDQTTLVVVTHDSELTRLGDRTLVIRDGEIVSEGA
jgi:putative ABC transport system ATP-binding protein/lipoprotein-releasing system ATP-binding protein